MSTTRTLQREIVGSLENKEFVNVWKEAVVISFQHFGTSNLRSIPQHSRPLLCLILKINKPAYLMFCLGLLRVTFRIFRAFLTLLKFESIFYEYLTS
jgi:hypothetical protein